MADDSFQERTEQATPRKREEARRKGHVARSQELVSVTVLGAGLLALHALGPGIVARLAALSRGCFADPLATPLAPDTLPPLATGLFREVVLALAPFTAVVAATGFLANVAQTGFLLSGEGVTPRLDRIDPLRRLKAYLSTRGLVEAAKMLAKVAVVTAVAALAVRAEMPRLLALSWGGPAASSAEAWRVAFGVGMKVVGLLLVVAVLDAAYQRWQHERDIRMSRDELKEEYRQQEGDPMIKARVRSVQRELARRRMMAEVPKADVVVTNPTHVAVALRYDPDTMGAPVVVAKGMRRVAERIRAIAREHGVPVLESPALARTIFKAVKVGGVIPVALYRAVAEILALAYRLKGRRI